MSLQQLLNSQTHATNKVLSGELVSQALLLDSVQYSSTRKRKRVEESKRHEETKTTMLVATCPVGVLFLRIGDLTIN